MTISLLREQYILHRAGIKLQTLLSANILYKWAFISFAKTEGPIVKHHCANTHIPPDYVSCLNQHRIKGRKQTNLSSLQTHEFCTLTLLGDTPGGKTHFCQEASEALLKTWQTKRREYWAKKTSAEQTAESEPLFLSYFTGTATVPGLVCFFGLLELLRTFK